MIVGIGTDIIEIRRVKRALNSRRFKERVYTPDERNYCESRGMQAAASFAARFAGKEAVMKAFCADLRHGMFADIEILPDANGCPRVTLKNYFARLAETKKISKIHVSLSHSREYATADCVLEATVV